MTKKEFEKLCVDYDFNYAVNQLEQQDHNILCVWDKDELIYHISYLIKKENFDEAITILNSIKHNKDCDYWLYDGWNNSIEIRPIKSVKDIEFLLENDEEV